MLCKTQTTHVSSHVSLSCHVSSVSITRGTFSTDLTNRRIKSPAHNSYRQVQVHLSVGTGPVTGWYRPNNGLVQLHLSCGTGPVTGWYRDSYRLVHVEGLLPAGTSPFTVRYRYSCRKVQVGYRQVQVQLPSGTCRLPEDTVIAAVRYKSVTGRYRYSYL